MQLLSLKKFLSSFKIKYLDLLFLFLPVFSSLILTFFAEFIYNRYINNYIQNIQIIDTASLDKVKSLSFKVGKESVKANLLANTLNIPNINTTTIKPVNLPPLEKVLPIKENPPISSQTNKENIQIPSQPNKLANLKLQATYISSTQKFAVIDGKIYREGSVGPFFKVLVIDINKVQIETDTRERIWLELR